MTQPPHWWDSVIADPAVTRLGIEWRDPTEFKPVHAEAWPGTMSNELLDSLDAEIRTGKVLVGTGPSVSRREVGVEATVHWYLDPSTPDKLWCALDESYVAWLWIPVEPTADAISDVLSGTHPKPALTRLELTGFTRGYLGFLDEVQIPQVYTGEMVPFNGHDLDRYFTMVRYVEHDSWASSQLDDPLRDDLPDSSPLTLLAAARNGNAKAQLLGRIPSMTWRTLHSRSYLSFEIHTRDVVCAAVRYRPAPAAHHTVVAALNDKYHADFPHDLPLDVVGALAGFNFARERGLIHNLTEPSDPTHLTAGLRVFAALWCGDLRQTLRLREFARHDDPQVRLEVARAAAWYGYRFLLEEMALAETDPTMVASLESLVIQGSDADTYNAFGDFFDGAPVMIDRNGAPVETWGDGGAEDDTDDDETDWDDDSERAK